MRGAAEKTSGEGICREHLRGAKNTRYVWSKSKGGGWGPSPDGLMATQD